MERTALNSVVTNALRYDHGQISFFPHGFIFAVMVITALMMSSMNAQAGSANADKTWQMGAPIITYWAGPLPMTDASAKQIAEAGFNLAWVTTRGKPKAMSIPEFYVAQLDILHKFGIRGNVTITCVGKDPNNFKTLTDPQLKADLDAVIATIKDHPAMYSYHLIDEPQPKVFNNIAKAKEYILSKDPSHLVDINLYPNYAPSYALVGTEKTAPEIERTEAYRRYLDAYINIINPQLICFDHYNFALKGQNDSYFLNLAEIRRASLDHNIPFMSILQGSTWTKEYAIPTCEQLRWLAYTALAYGTQGISWYVYGYPAHDGGFVYPAGTYREPEIAKKMGSVVLGGKPTPRYYFVKEELHKEFLNIATELQLLKSTGVFHAGMIPEGTIELPENNAFKLEPRVESKPCPAFVGGSYKDHNGKYPINYYEEPLEGFVVGCFGNDKETTHALVVNLDYRTYGGRGQERQAEFLNPVKRMISGPGRLEVFDAQTGKWYDAEGSKVRLRLPPGGGVLVRVAQ